MAPAIETLVRTQAGVVTRAQVLACGRTTDWLRWQVRRGGWRPLHPRTYLTYTGPITWRTRAFAAVLYAGEGAALAGTAAAFELGILRREPATVEVAVPAHRRVAPQPGLVIRTRTGLAGCVVRAAPPRTRVDETVVDLIRLAPDVDALVGLLCDGVRAGAHPRTLADLLAPRPRWRWRGLALEALQECSTGVESPLERRNHRDVLRAHGLPPFSLQVRQKPDGWWIRADARCERFRTRIELDGRLAHPGGRTDDDTWRDNEVVIVSDDRTLRYRWSHVAGRPCLTAGQVAAALRAGGWDGVPRRCGAGCLLGAARSRGLRGR